MNYKSIVFSISKVEYFRIRKNYLNKNYKNIEESSYEDSYFDTTLQEFKNNSLEFIIRKNSISNNKYIIILENKKTYTNLVEYKSNIDFEISDLEFSVDFLEGKYKGEFNKIFTLQVKEYKYKIDQDIIYLKEVSYIGHINYELEILTKEDVEHTGFKYINNFNLKKSKQISRTKNYFKELKNKKKNNEVFMEDKNLYVEDFIVVVEGKNDTLALKEVYPNIITFETHGLGLTQEKIKLLDSLAKNNNKKILILTDPDTPGEIIRKRITSVIPGVYHKYVYNLGVRPSSKKKIGIEALTNEEISDIFSDLKQKKESPLKYTMDKLIELDIYANKKKREEFCKANNIAYGNNKKVLKQINDYNIKI